MTNAQQVCRRRLEENDKILEKEVEKIFEWILAKMCRKEVDTFTVFLCYDCYMLYSYQSGYYDLYELLLNYERESIFKALAKLINKKEGFKAKLFLNHTVYDVKAIRLKVSIVK